MARGLKKAKSAKRTRVELGDHGTPERRQHDPVRTEETMTAGVRVARVQILSAADNLLKRRAIDSRMHEAAERLAAQYRTAAAGRRVISGYQEPTTGIGEMSDKAAEAWAAFCKAIRAVGVYHSGIVIHVVCEDLSIPDWVLRKRIEPEAARDRLRVGLSLLADHYRLPNKTSCEEKPVRPVRIRAVRA